MIHISILCHFKLFFMFCYRYINSHVCLVISNFLFIGKKYKPEMFFDIDINIDPQKINYHSTFEKFDICHF